MLDSVRKSVAIPQIPARVFMSVGVLAAFTWLLAHDLLHPMAIYLLQLYLAF